MFGRSSESNTTKQHWKTKARHKKPMQVNVGQFHLRIGDEEALDIRRLLERNEQFEEDYKQELGSKKESATEHKLLSIGQFSVVSLTANRATKDGQGLEEEFSEEQLLAVFQEELAHLKQYHYEVLQRMHLKEAMFQRYREHVKNELDRLKFVTERTNQEIAEAERKKRHMGKDFEKLGTELQRVESEIDKQLEKIKLIHAGLLSQLEEEHAKNFRHERKAHEQLQQTSEKLTQQIQERRRENLAKKTGVIRKLDLERLELIDELAHLKTTNALQVREIMAASHLFHIVNEHRAMEHQEPLDLKKELRTLCGDREITVNAEGYYHAYSPGDGSAPASFLYRPDGGPQTCLIC